MAAICQAEVRLVLCHVGSEPSPGGGGGASTRSDAGPAGTGDQESACPGPSQGPSSETQQAPRAGIKAGAGVGPEAESQPPASPAPAPAASAPSRGAPPGPSLLQLSMLLPPPAMGSVGVAPGPCRSVQCHVAWVGEVEDAVRYGKEGHGFDAASSNDVLTLVVGWGPELELVSWSTGALRAAAAAAAAPSTAVAGTSAGDDVYGNGLRPLSPVSRRTLLLGVPGPLCAVSLGPYGTVLATTEAGLALSYSPVQAPVAERHRGPASEGGTGNDAGRAGGGGGGCEAARSDGTDRSAGRAQATRPDFEDTHQKQQEPHKQLETEVIDLRGVLAVAGSTGLTQFGDGGSGEGAGPSLAGLFNISAGVRLDGDGDGGAGTGGMGARGHKAAAAVPRQFLLGAEGLTCGRSVGSAASSTVPGATTAAVVAAASAGALCVVWPCRSVAAAATAAAPGDYLGRWPCSHPTAPDAHPSRGPAAAAATAGPASGGVGGDAGGGFCSLAPLHLPRPDLLSCCGGLVLAASSLGPPVVAAFRLAPNGGLTQLACLTPAWPPDVIAAGRGRLRGLAAALVPPSCGGDGGGAAAVAAGDGQEVRGHGGGRHSAAMAAAAVDSPPEAVLVVAAGEVEAAPAGGGIFGFGRSGRTVGQKMVRLVASAHPLPPLLAAAAATAVAEMAAEAGAAAAWEARPSGITGTAAPAADAAAPCLAGSAPCERSDEAKATSLGPLTAPAADVIVAAVVGQLAELLAGFRRHVDQRLDELAGALEAQAARLDRIEVALGARQRQQPGEALLQRREGDGEQEHEKLRV